MATSFLFSLLGRPNAKGRQTDLIDSKKTRVCYLTLFDNGNGKEMGDPGSQERQRLTRLGINVMAPEICSLFS